MAITKRFASEDYVIENIEANKTELEKQISLFDKKIDVLENKKIDSPDIANPGQMIVVKTVDDAGKPTEFEAVNIPKTEGGGITVETDPTVPSWAKQPTKPNYTKSDVGLSNVDNIKQYSAENEPPYPVTSVNGKTGSVQLTASDVEARPNTWMPSASDVGALPNTTKIPSSTSDLTNNSGFITKAVSDLANYYLKTETYSKEELDNKISAIPKFAIEVVSSLPTSNISATTVYLVVTGDEENNIYTEYIYVSGRWEYLGKQTVDLTNYVKRTELSIYYSKTEIESLLEELRNFIPTRLSQLADDSSHRTVTDAEKESWNAKSTFSGSYTDLTNKPSIPSLSGYATENFVKGYAQPAGNYLTTIPSEYVTETELSGKGYLTEHQDLSDYAKRSELPTDYAKSVHEHDQYLTAVPSEYITESELNAKKYLTSVPGEYITESELSAKGYLTQHQSLDGYAKTSQIPTKTSQLTNDSDFATNESFNKIGGTVEITSDNPVKENTVLTVNPETIDEINLYSAEEIDNLIESVRNGSSSGEIPNLDGYATETYVKNYAQPKGSYLSSIPSEYVTETELNSKGYLTSIPDDIVTHKDDTSMHVVYGVCETAGDVADKVVSVNGNFILKEGAIVIVRFINANSIAAPTLNVNGTGAKPMYRYGTTTMSTGTTTTGWVAGAIQMFTYNGEGWIRDYWNNTTYSNAALGHGYVTCSTDEATTAKTASLSSYALTTGGRVTVKFSNAVPANSTLNVNSKGAKAIYYRGAKITDGVIKAGDIATFVYSTYYHLISIDRWQEDIDEISSELNAVKEEIVDEVTARKNAITDVQQSIVNLGGEVIPNYVNEESEKIADLILRTRNANTFVMSVATDLHTTGNDTSAVGVEHIGIAMSKINAITPFDLASLLGDYEVYYFNYGSGDTDGEDARLSHKHKNKSFAGIKKSVPFIELSGNHDFNPSDSQTDRKQKSFAYIGANNIGTVVDYENKFRNYGYRDFENHKIRVVYLNTVDVYDKTDSTSCFVSTEQLNWLNSVAFNLPSDDWYVIVLSHHPLNWSGMESVLNALNTFKGNGGKLAVHIHGHIHNFRVETLGTNNVLSMTIPNGCFDRNNEYGTASSYDETIKANFGDTDKNGNQRQFNKTKNTAEETSFNVVLVDTEEEQIHAYCYGAGIHRIVTFDGVLTEIEKDETGEPETPVVPDEPDTPAFTNLVPTSIGTDNKVYNGSGYKEGYRLSGSSGNESQSTGSVVSGFIPVKAGDVIRVYGSTDTNHNATGNYVCGYKSDFSYIANSALSATDAAGNKGEWSTLNGKVLWTLDTSLFTTMPAYIRASMYGCIGANFVITINEEIV